MQNLASSDSHIDFEPDSNVNQETDYTSNIDSQPDEEQFNNQQQFNNQPVNYQQSYQNRPHKNMWIAVILDIIGGLIFYFLCGIGQIYLGLVKRGIVLGVCGLAISILNVVLMFALGDGFGSIISLILGLALLVYSAYDAYRVLMQLMKVTQYHYYSVHLTLNKPPLFFLFLFIFMRL